MKKGDFIIIAVVIAAAVMLAIAFFSSGEASRVIIKQDDKILYNQSIDQNVIFDTGTNVIVIKDKTVQVESADCKNQDCVKHGKISKKGESIICLPNKVIVEIE